MPADRSPTVAICGAFLIAPYPNPIDAPKAHRGRLVGLEAKANNRYAISMVPIVRYTGCKSKVTKALWALPHIPRPKIFVDVFGGSGRFLDGKPVGGREYYNDVDGRLANFYQQFVSESHPAMLAEDLITLTLGEDGKQRSAREMHKMAMKVMDDTSSSWTPYGRALWTAVYFGLSYKNPDSSIAYFDPELKGYEKWWGKKKKDLSKKENTIKNAISNANKLWNFFHPETIGAMQERWKNVRVINEDWKTILRRYKNNPNAMLYLDPPYLWKDLDGTPYRNRYTPIYKFDDLRHPEVHQRYLEAIQDCKCMLAISHFDCRMYRQLIDGRGWERMPIEIEGEYKRGTNTDCLWVNHRFSTVMAVNKCWGF